MILKNTHFLGLMLVLCAGLAFMLAGCSHDSDDVPNDPTTVEILMEKGWTDFLGGDYSSAITRFRQILNRDATVTEAYVGLGWAYTYAGTFDKGLNNFIFAQARPDFDPYEAEVYAGLASNYAASDEDSIAVYYAQKALGVDPDWVFRMDADLTARDLNVLIAQSYFNDRKYYYAKEQVNALEQDWSDRFVTTSVSDMITPLEWSVTIDSIRVSFQLPEAGISTFGETGRTAAAVASVPAAGINTCNCAVEITSVESDAPTEYWKVVCVEEVRKGGIFKIVGSVSDTLPTPFDLNDETYVADHFSFRMHFDNVEGGRRQWKYPLVGDHFTFATAEADVPFVVDQIKNGNQVYISLDPAATNARFFRDVDYTIYLDYSYYYDFGDFLVQLLEKINSLFQ